MFLEFPVVLLRSFMKQKILEKAGEMFVTLGFKSVTMDDIANEMAVSKKTIYKYFINKKSLVSEAADKIHNTWYDVVNHIQSQDYNPVKEGYEIERMSEEMFKNATSSPLYQLKKYYPDICSRIMEEESVFFMNCVKGNLKKGIEQGYYRKNINIEHYAEFYFALVFSVYERANLDHDLEKEVYEYHMRAVSTAKGIKELEKLITNKEKN